MTSTNVSSRALHDVGLAGWFGGTLANAVALNAAAGQVSDPNDAGAVTNAGWDRWTPVNAAAVAAHLVGSVGQLLGNRDRLSTQKGVGTMSVAKAGLTAAALGVSVWARVLGKKVSSDQRVPLHDATTANSETPDDVAAAQRQLATLQWAVPALTGALVVLSAFAGEQQRPAAVLSGLRRRVTS